ncbi:hypothetical protein ACQPUY_02490 [Clostridium nigeriense]|uniref:hypothetical protein n=1 Tax=Clostridium nigeriense TaxID=1805470 RepID=UPI003D3548B3
MLSDLKIMLDVNNEKKEIQVESEINFSDNVYNLKLILNEGLILNKITDWNGNEVIYNEELNANALFIQSGKRVTLKIPEGTKSITMIYSGNISGWHNTITDNYIALNFYSAWYPIFEDYDMEIAKKVTVKNISDFTVVKGRKNKEDWEYESNDFDCNILAVKDWNSISLENFSPKLNIYFNNRQIEEVKELSKSFSNIISYFTGLLDVESNINGTFDIVIPSSDEGGYCREGLIVLGDLPSDRIDVDDFLAHECGHIWSTGADVNSWEDWLNETFAEVLSLSFIKKKYGVEAYKKRINDIREIAKKSPQIKSENGERPDGVHFKGTYLMHRLSEIFGEDTLIEIVKLFVRLQNKTTENLLREIKLKVGTKVSKFIEEKLTER